MRAAGAMRPLPNRPPATIVTTRIRISPDELLKALRRSPAPALREALESTLRRLQGDARNGRGLLTEVLGQADAFVEWEHYPPRDAVDPRSGFRFYYHAHEAARRAADEHGHFHVFATRARVRGDEPSYVHLFAISVDARGMPTRVFTTNRWVTGEHWQSAPTVLSALRRLDLSGARPRRVAGWVQDMARLFAPQIEAVIRERDLRIAERARRQPLQQLLEDRRTHIVSQCAVDLARQFECLEQAGVA